MRLQWLLDPRLTKYLDQTGIVQSDAFDELVVIHFVMADKSFLYFFYFTKPRQRSLLFSLTSLLLVSLQAKMFSTSLLTKPLNVLKVFIKFFRRLCFEVRKYSYQMVAVPVRGSHNVEQVSLSSLCNKPRYNLNEIYKIKAE